MHIRLLFVIIFISVSAFPKQKQNNDITTKINMGTFGINNFDNDGVYDWLILFSQEPNLSKIELTLNEVIQTKEYLEVDGCYFGIASCELIAKLNGKMSPSFPEDFKYLNIDISQDELSLLKTKAIKCLDRIKSHSELKELWMDDKENYPKWVQVINELESRLL